jgi:hypothetical protein
VRSVGTSVAATVLRASMRPSMRRKRGIRSLPASSRVRIGSSITRRGGWSRVWSCFRRIRIRRINQYLDRQGEFQPIGNRCCTSWRRSIFYEREQDSSSAMSKQYFGMDRYVRPIDLSSRFWLKLPLIEAPMSTAITVLHFQRKPGLPGHRICNERCIERIVNEHCTNRAEEL